MDKSIYSGNTKIIVYMVKGGTMFRIFKDKLFNGNSRGNKESVGNIKLKNSLKENKKMFEDIFSDDDTVIFRDFKIDDLNTKCMLILVDGMTDTKIVNENVIKSIMSTKINKNISKNKLLDELLNNVLTIDEMRRTSDIDLIIGSVLYGNTIFLVDGIDEAILINTKGWTVRAISEPSSERIVRGPRDGFSESMVVNLSLIRRRITCANLKFKYKEIGTKTKTHVCVSYIEGIANEKILKEVEKRLEKIDIDGIIDSNYIEELISDSPVSPFETIGYTERPDVVAGRLLEGRIALIVDGTPVVLTLPFIFMEYFQANQDYYNHFIFASMNRLLRYLAFFLSTSTPAIYVALTTFHQEMIPTPLLLSIASARDGVPFPTIVEAIGMMIVFELLREGGIRLPEPVGATVSIVGALVLGEAAVSAKFVSAPIVIVVALTGITSFLIYPMKGAIIVIRVIFLILAGFLGLYGYIFGVIGLFIHLMSMRSFGIPYMIDLGSLNKQDVKDTVIRAPWWYMYYRPKLIGDRNSVRKSDASRKGIK